MRNFDGLDLAELGCMVFPLVLLLLVGVCYA